MDLIDGHFLAQAAEQVAGGYPCFFGRLKVLLHTEQIFVRTVTPLLLLWALTHFLEHKFTLLTCLRPLMLRLQTEHLISKSRLGLSLFRLRKLD